MRERVLVREGRRGRRELPVLGAHAAPAWGQVHDRPLRFVAFGDGPLIRRILDPESDLAYWNQHAFGGHFPAMEAPDVLVDDLRAFFAGIS